MAQKNTDTFELSTKNSSETKAVETPKISTARVLFHRFTNEQIEQLNESKQLPKNAKVVDNKENGKPKITWNIADITQGTHTIPAGYELKNDILGFSHLVREDSKAWYLKNN
jgi:hypothetical protein